MRRKYEHISTSTLRSMKAVLGKRPIRWIWRRTLNEIEYELLARELPEIAEESGGYPVCPVTGLQ
jgi:hypothetical protein